MSGAPRSGPVLLEVRDLSVRFRTRDGIVHAVSNLSFTLRRGETLGVVGESGSGKSVSSLAIMGLLNRAYADVEGEILFEGTDLLKLPPDKLREVRGRDISMIFQDPFASLHPMYRVGAQIAEAVRVHEDVSKREAWERAVELLAAVGIPNARSRARDYPHQFSGGMRQRAMIAMALSLEPRLIIADEPTTALDATVQAQILDLLLRLQQESNTALIMITHDLGVVADIADDVMVMYAGRAVEKAPKREVFYSSHHPYTKGLLESIPSSSAAGERLRPIAGQPPSLINLPSGCKFHPRCGYVFDRCLREEPGLRPVDASGLHFSACWLPAAAAGLSAEAEELREETVLGQRGEEAAEVAAAAAAELGRPASEEGGA